MNSDEGKLRSAFGFLDFYENREVVSECANFTIVADKQTLSLLVPCATVHVFENAADLVQHLLRSVSPFKKVHAFLRSTLTVSQQREFAAGGVYCQLVAPGLDDPAFVARLQKAWKLLLACE